VGLRLRRPGALLCPVHPLTRCAPAVRVLGCSPGPLRWGTQGPALGAPRIHPPPDPLAFVSTIDVLPTVLEAAGLAVPEGLDGRSLWPLIRGEPPSSDWPDDAY